MPISLSGMKRRAEKFDHAVSEINESFAANFIAKAENLIISAFLIGKKSGFETRWYYFDSKRCNWGGEKPNLGMLQMAASLE